MSKASKIMEYLRPDGGYLIYGEDYQGIQFVECEPVSKEEYDKVVKDWENIESEMLAIKAATKQAILDKLGISLDDLKALGL